VNSSAIANRAITARTSNPGNAFMPASCTDAPLRS
jgi:hypothetical protein